jgi:hypothetical protein
VQHATAAGPSLVHEASAPALFYAAAAKRKGISKALCGAPFETPWDGYPQRTEWNVRDSDGTLILTRGQPDRGTALTVRLAQQRQKPCLGVDLAGDADVAAVHAWAAAHQVETLNVAGPRESSAPGIYEQAVEFLRRLFGEGKERSTKPRAAT